MWIFKKKPKNSVEKPIENNLEKQMTFPQLLKKMVQMINEILIKPYYIEIPLDPTMHKTL